MAKKDEVLVCNCDDDANHVMNTDKNGETVIECTVCKRFLKFEKDDKTKYKGNFTEKAVEEEPKKVTSPANENLRAAALADKK